MDTKNRQIDSDLFNVQGLTSQETLIISTRRVHIVLGKKVETIIKVEGKEVLRFE